MHALTHLPTTVLTYFDLRRWAAREFCPICVELWAVPTVASPSPEDMVCCEGSNPDPNPSSSPSPSPSPSPRPNPNPHQVCCEGCQLWAHASCDLLSPKQLRLLDHTAYYCPGCRGELPGHGVGGDNQPPGRRNGLPPAGAEPPTPPQPAPAPAPLPAAPPKPVLLPLPPPPPPPPSFQAELAAPYLPSPVDMPTVRSTIIWAGEMAQDGNEIARDGNGMARDCRVEIPQVTVAIATPATAATALVATAGAIACGPPPNSYSFTGVAAVGPSPEEVVEMALEYYTHNHVLLSTDCYSPRTTTPY